MDKNIAIQLALQGYDSKKIAEEITFRKSHHCKPFCGDPMEAELIDTLTIEQLYDIGSAMKHEEDRYEEMMKERENEEIVYPY